MANQYKNHIVYFGDTLIDLRSDTVTAETLLEGYTAHDASGAVITGTYVPTSSAITVITTPDSHGGVIKEIVAVDISRDTVTASTLLQGYTAHDRQGNAITGTYVPSGGSVQANKNVTPSESQQIVGPDTGYDALAQVTVAAISSDYIGSGVTRRSSSDLTATGATVTVPAGYYEEQATKSVSTGSATPASSITSTGATVSTSGTNTLTLSKSVSNTPQVSAGYISSGTSGNSSVSLSATVNIRSSSDLTASGATVTVPAGYYASQASKSITTGTATSATSISGTSATISTGTNTITLTKTVSNTPRITTAGYISSGTAGNSSVSLTASVTTKAAATITPGTTNQTISSGTYLTGTQTIVGDANLVGSNILSGVSIFGVAGTVTFQTYYTGSSAPSSSLGIDGDIYLRTS